eukprot:2353411-Pyramimonas_sp.AAC.1
MGSSGSPAARLRLARRTGPGQGRPGDVAHLPPPRSVAPAVDQRGRARAGTARGEGRRSEGRVPFETHLANGEVNERRALGCRARD